MPCHGNYLDRLLGVLPAPEAPNAAERQTLQFCKDVCNLLGNFRMVFIGYSDRQRVRNGAAAQVLHEDVWVAKRLVSGYFKVENPRKRYITRVLVDYLHRSDFAEHRSPIFLMELLV